jgi:hypothetical protein
MKAHVLGKPWDLASEVHNMKRILLILFVCLPSLALANSITLDTKDGLLTGSSSGLVDRMSEVIDATGFTGDLGKITFSTGKLISGSLEEGGKFAAGGTLTFFDNGFDRTHKGIDFTGTFSSPVTWTLVTLSNGTHEYTLTGHLSGKWFSGQSVTGVLFEMTLNTGKGLYQGDGTLQAGTLTVTGSHIRLSTVPEPSSMIFIATGLLGVGPLVKKRFSLFEKRRMSRGTHE